MRSRRARVLPFIILSTVGGACAVLHRTPPLTWRLVVELDQSVPDIQNATSLTASIIERRLDTVGIGNSKVSVVDASAGRIEIKLPDVSDRERFKSFLTSGGKLEIVHIISPPSPAPILLYDKPESATGDGNFRVLPFSERGLQLKKWARVEIPALISNRDVRNASAIPAKGDNFHIAFTLRQEGAQKLSSWTQNNINQYVGVVLNDEIKSTAFIKSQISDSGEITGNFTKQAAEDLVQILMSGSYPGPVRIVEEARN